MVNKRKVCLVTGSRAEYGLMRWLIEYFAEDPNLEFQLIATGMHLSPEFGLTYKIIEKDGFKISEKIEILLSSETPTAIAKSTGLTILSFSEVLKRLKPDILVVLGDRFEIFAVAQTAMILNIPIAHIHGGEITQGAFDEAMRHSITKMSHLHFVATEEYRKRVIQLGEQPHTVFNYGSPGLDNLHKVTLLSKEELQAELGLKFGKINFLITYHPVTLHSYEQVEKTTEHLLSALDQFPEAQIFFTKSNADPSGRLINRKFEDFVAKNTHRSVIHVSLGQQKFLSLLTCVDVMIGNSSSALIEAAALKIPAVNVGPRQNGRLKSSSVLDCQDGCEEIVNTIHKAISLTFRESLKFGYFPYGGGGDNSFKIYKKIKEYPLDHILYKEFYDI